MLGDIDSLFELRELSRRLSNLFDYYKVMEVKNSMIKVEMEGGALSPQIPILRDKADDEGFSRPRIKKGSLVAILCPSGDLSRGIVLGAVPSDKHHGAEDIEGQIYEDGTQVFYDTKNKKLTAKLAEGGTADISADGGIFLNGPVTVDGELIAKKKVTVEGETILNKNTTVKGDASFSKKIEAKGEISSQTEVKAMTVMLTKHVHPDPASGSTGTPTP